MKTFRLLIALLFLVNINIFSQDVLTITEEQVPDFIDAGGKEYKINDSVSYIYSAPKLYEFLPNAIEDIYIAPDQLFKKENVWYVAGIAASTAVLIYYDEKLINSAQQFGRYINLSQDNKTYDLSPIKSIPLYVPTDLSSGLYYLGDGILEIGVNAGFYVYGFAKSDARALRTASELSEGLVAIGVSVQVLKHLTGRTTAMANNNKDHWDFFPSLKQYHGRVPKYDAYPSGHLATAMMSTTIISMNYPEYKFIKPLGYTLMTLCGYQMMNNGVHWASDYPLAIAMGYTLGKIAVNRGRLKVIKNGVNHTKTSFFNPKYDIKPVYMGYGATGLSLKIDF